MKLTKAFRGVPDGEIYPVDYAAGDDCPGELETAAQAQGCLEGESDADREAREATEREAAEKAAAEAAEREAAEAAERDAAEKAAVEAAEREAAEKVAAANAKPAKGK